MSGLRRKCPRARTRLRGAFRRSEQRTQKASLRFQEGAAETGVVGLVAARFPAFRGAAPPPPPGGRSRWRRGGWAGGPRGAGGARPPRPDPTPSQHLRFRSRRNARCPRVHDPDKLGTRAGATGVASATPGGPCCAGWWGMGGNVASVTGEHPDSPASASPRPAVGTPHPGSREDLLLPRRI